MSTQPLDDSTLGMSQIDFASELSARYPENVVVAPITSSRVVKRLKNWDDDLKRYRTIIEYVYHPQSGQWRLLKRQSGQMLPV